jgi:hypothetical protein
VRYEEVVEVFGVSVDEAVRWAEGRDLDVFGSEGEVVVLALGMVDGVHEAVLGG